MSDHSGVHTGKNTAPCVPIGQGRPYRMMNIRACVTNRTADASHTVSHHKLCIRFQIRTPSEQACRLLVRHTRTRMVFSRVRKLLECKSCKTRMPPTSPPGFEPVEDSPGVRAVTSRVQNPLGVVSSTTHSVRSLRICRLPDLNRGQLDLQSSALPI